jgi:hypothetical protein
MSLTKETLKMESLFLYCTFHVTVLLNERGVMGTL